MGRWIELALLVAVAGCGDTVSGQRPVLSDEPDPVAMERFARRLHLDLAGRVADDEYVESAVESLTAGGNSPSARAELADDLLGGRDFADTYVGEVDNRIFGGDNAFDRYNLLCDSIRDDVPACGACPAPGPTESLCGGCSCSELVSVNEERLALGSAAADLAADDLTTSEVDQRFATSRAVRLVSAPETTAQALFESFLGRPAEGEELRNSTMMIFGLTLGSAPAGLLFHRHGASFDDLISILFESDVYREATVNAAFARYLGRRATPAELAHFADQLDAENPDIRPVIKSVTSSLEYFDQ